MSSHEIYPYIPFASALVWNRSQADPSPVKVHVSFTPDWFAARMGLDMRGRWHRDPLYRRESFVEMAEALNREFPSLCLGGDPRAIKGGLSQIDGCGAMAALFGQGIAHSRKAWPENIRRYLTDEEAEALQVPEVDSSPVMEDLRRQMDIIEREWGSVDGELNLQGVLNTAFRLRGESIFTDMIVAPERAHRVLGVVCRAMIQLEDAVYARQARTGVRKDYFVTSNCVVNMLSEEHYRAFVMPYDRQLSDHWPCFGIHNCGWKVDAYARAYSEIRPLGYLDFGIKSDLQNLKQLFPDTVLTAILNPDDILGREESAVRADLERLRDAL